MLFKWFIHEVVDDLDESVAENTLEENAVLEWIRSEASRRLASMTVIETIGQQRNIYQNSNQVCLTKRAASQTPVPHARDKGQRPSMAQLFFQA